MARETVPWDAADTLQSKEDIAAYLDAVLEDGDPELLKAALGDIARAKGMTGIARGSKLGRANLYKALSPEGNPEFVTVAKVLRLLGFGFPFPPCASRWPMMNRLPNGATIIASLAFSPGGRQHLTVALPLFACTGLVKD